MFYWWYFGYPDFDVCTVSSNWYFMFYCWYFGYPDFDFCVVSSNWDSMFYWLYFFSVRIVIISALFPQSGILCFKCTVFVYLNCEFLQSGMYSTHNSFSIFTVVVFSI